MNKDWEKEAYRKFMNAPDKMMEALKREENKQPDENFIHLTYSGSIIPKEDILKFEKQLKSVGLKLGYIDADRQANTHHYDFDDSTVIRFAVNIVQDGVSDIIIAFIVWTWQQVKNLKSERKPITETTASIGKSKKITYEYPINLSAKTVKKAMDNLSRTIDKHKKKYKDVDTCDELYILQKNGRWKRQKDKSDDSLLKKLLRKVKA